MLGGPDLRLAASSLLLVVACSKPAAPPPEAGAPVAPAIRWAERDLIVTGHDAWKLHVDYDAAGAKVTMTGWPSDAKVMAGATALAAGSNAPVPVFAWLGSVAVWRQDVEAGAYFPPDVAVPGLAPLVITLADGAVISTKLPAGNAPPQLVEAAMAKAARDGLVFEGEADRDPKAPHSIYFLDPIRSDEVIGPAATLEAIDWVALVQSKVESGGGATCTFVGGKRYPLERETQTITITTRKTHERVDEKVFAAAAGCPMVALDERAIATPARDVVFAWLRDVAKSR